MSRSKDSGYRNTKNKRGQLSIHIREDLTDKINWYCSMANKNRTRFIEQCLDEKLNEIITEFLSEKSHDELVSMVSSVIGAKAPKQKTEQQLVYIPQKEE